MDLKMILTLITSLGLLPFAAGASRAVCPDSPIVAEEGSAVSLPCHLDPQVSVVTRTVDWKKDGLGGVVLSYRHRQQNRDDQRPEFRTRTTLNGDLSRGNLSLRISSVTLSDSGSYRCFVPKLHLGCVTVLVVELRDQQNRTERRDSSTTVAPVEEEPESADQDAAKNPAVWKIILGVVVVAAVVVLLLLWKREAIKEAFTGTRRTASHDVEMVTTTTRQTKADEGRHVEAGEPLVRDENRSSG